MDESDVTEPTFAEKYPPWLVITIMIFALFVIGAAVILILTNHSLTEYVQFISGIWAGVLALFATGNALGAKNAAKAVERRLDAMGRDAGTNP
jgi:hypothetical protein